MLSQCSTVLISFWKSEIYQRRCQRTFQHRFQHRIQRPFLLPPTQLHSLVDLQALLVVRHTHVQSTQLQKRTVPQSSGIVSVFQGINRTTKTKYAILAILIRVLVIQSQSQTKAASQNSVTVNVIQVMKPIKIMRNAFSVTHLHVQPIPSRRVKNASPSLSTVTVMRVSRRLTTNAYQKVKSSLLSHLDLCFNERLYYSIIFI
mmetsp:Transcript_30803/g.38013  ORF Transcript_30803/g.38013 Transcript_30803/m.38013 type:complete len:203 (-) Transcript_30803:63-671(-)